MPKQVIFVGGIHGAGKTSSCYCLCQALGCITTKQRRALIHVGTTNNLHTWEQIGVHHDRLIEQAADWVISNLIDKSDILLLDCHYAIRTAKALRIPGQNDPRTYIPDLDYRFVQKLGEKFKVRFVLFLVKPETAFERTADRPPDVLDYDNTKEGLVRIEKFETFYFHEMIKRFKIDKGDVLLINANKGFEIVVSRLKTFILFQNS